MKILSYVLVFLTALVLTAPSSLAQPKLLGKIDFPNSGAPGAQDHFIQGVLFLHNFEYADAARAFRQARQTDPGFAMAYYGEAKSYNHPIWMEQNRSKALEVLNELGSTVQERQAKASTEREKDLMMSLEVLYGNTPETRDLNKEERDDAYRDFMAELHQKYPEDHEITAFYGLSILGSAHEGRDFSIYMEAAAELFEIWEANKKHPGAAHYLIHSFDDPVHAPLGLPMARAYSEIAPAAAHAQHMTSHIFLALGMWEDVIKANIVARDVQTTRQKELDEKTTVCGHYPWWLQYGYLQDGNTEKAAEVLQSCMERIDGSPGGSELWHFAVMRGHQIVDTENWEAADEWTASIQEENNPGINYYFTNALAHIQRGNIAAAKASLDKLKSTPERDERNIQIKQIEGMLLVSAGENEQGIALIKEAVSEESALPIAFGPPTIVKPSHELLGDVYLDLGSYKKAAESYKKQLERTPNRLLSKVRLKEAQQMSSD